MGQQGTIFSTATIGNSVADVIVQYLQQLGVEYVFGIPGGAIEPLYNALADSEDSGGPRAITSRHETGAAFMADGYYTQTGKLGVCCATTGPGATNLVTGVASAYVNHIPLLVITAQTPLASFGSDAFQESSCTGVNILAMFEPCTRFNTLVSHPSQLPVKLVKAVMIAFEQRCPVHLSIPIDVMKTLCTHQLPDKPLPHHLLPIHLPQVADIALTLQQTPKPVMVLGAQAVQAIGSILVLAKLLNADIICTPQGKGLVHQQHENYCGVIGFAGHASAVEALLNPEVTAVLCIGTHFSEWASSGWKPGDVPMQTVIQIDSHSFGWPLVSAVSEFMVGDIAGIVAQLLKILAPLSKEIIPDIGQSKVVVNEFVESPEHIHPARLMLELPNYLPNHTHYHADIGASFAWSIHYLHPFDRRLKGVREKGNSLFRTCIEFASMGWAIGAAVGASLATPNIPMVCITGDGSVLMNGQEITVALQEQLPVIFIVLNDGALGMVKHGQRLTNAAPIGYEIPPVNFAAFANAMGVEAITIKTNADLQQLADIDFIHRREPLLIDVYIDPEAVPPINQRTNKIKAQ